MLYARSLAFLEISPADIGPKDINATCGICIYVNAHFRQKSQFISTKFDCMLYSKKGYCRLRYEDLVLFCFLSRVLIIEWLYIGTFVIKVSKDARREL